jgi:septum site-determining protein MinC
MTKTPATTENSKRTAFQLKGSLFTLTALQLFELDSSLLQEQLTIMVQQAPKFFQYAPIVIDLQKVNEQAADVNFSELVSLLRGLKLIPVGVRGVNSAQRTAAMTAGLAILPEAKTAEPSHAKTAAVTNTKATAHAPAIITSPSKVITQPVRSGQQIYAQGGDLIVITSVSPGAELLADGHIHIYGPLRGRALAGVTGDTQARIFCHSLEAELVSIAGHYWVSEDLKEAQTNAPVQIYLQDERLKLGPV